jgi:DNA-binding protein HU-beta
MATRKSLLGLNFGCLEAASFNSVAERANLSRSNAADVVNAVIEAIAAALGTGEEVRLVGFGTFAVVSRAASEGRNPRTGEKI